MFKQTTDQPEKNHFPPICNTSPTTNLEQKLNKTAMNNYPSPRESSVTNTKPSSIKQNEYHFKSLANLDSLKVPVLRRSQTDPQADTDLSVLQFCNSGGEADGSKAALNNLHIPELLLPQCFEDESQNESLNVMKTQKKPKTVPPCEQDVSDCSEIDSLSGISASSNDAARVIGEKRFWKMRTYMIKYLFLSLTMSVSLLMILKFCSVSYFLFLLIFFSQQKIFEAQVFELRRLIMVSS